MDEAEAQEKLDLNRPFEVSQSGIQALSLRNQYSIVGGTWLGTGFSFFLSLNAVIGTLAYNYARKDIDTAQKVINARLCGQSAALVGIVAAMVLTAYSPKNDDEGDSLADLIRKEKH